MPTSLFIYFGRVLIVTFGLELGRKAIKAELDKISYRCRSSSVEHYIESVPKLIAINTGFAVMAFTTPPTMPETVVNVPVSCVGCMILVC
jgi:hypothetical protein